MFISRPCDSAHGKGQIPVERRGSGGSHPTPIPGVDPQLLAGDFPCIKPRKAFPGFFFFGMLHTPRSQTSAPGWEWQKSKNLLLPRGAGRNSASPRERNKTFREHFPLFPNPRRRDVNSLQEARRVRHGAPGKFVTAAPRGSAPGPEHPPRQMLFLP